MIRTKITPPPIRKTQKSEESEQMKFVPLGGLEEIGRNCSFFEYKNEIVVIDVGIQFPEEATPGVDYIIPNVTYLESRKENIRGILLTHGHYDHVHALPYLLEKLGNPVIYAAPLTKAIVERRLKEFPNLPKAKFQAVENWDKIKISENFEAEFFNISHTIPDSMGVILHTPIGKVAHFGDFRVDINRQGEPENLEVFEKIGEMNIHSIFLDSTNAAREGHSISERIVEENLEKLFQNAKGRIIVGTFSSLLTRLAEMIKIAEKLDRKVAINGRSMRDNFQIAQNLGYIKVKKGLIINLEDVHKHPDNKILILSTGAQGEPTAGLMRIVTGEHQSISLKPTDTVIFSSSIVPGNERSVQALQDSIARQVDELYNSKLLDIHTSGHAHSEDLKLVIKLTKPKFVVPVHAYYFMRKMTVKIAGQVGVPRERVPMMDNGQVALLTPDKFEITKETVPAFYVMVDGLGIGDVEEVVLRDRRMLAQEGMLVIITTIDRTSGKILKTPDIISRGFIYLKENKEMLNEMRRRIKNIVGQIPRYQNTEPDYLKTLIRNQIGEFIYQKTKRRPMILPVLIEV